MEQSLYALKTALRVLAAITENADPDPADIEALRFLAPLLADQPLEELACDVIQQAITRRSQIRKQQTARSKPGGRNAAP